MKYLALLSGGKDSCYNLLHCAENGHELVAAASLGPQPGKEELDSYLYQTVGQDAIELVARALDTPLYRRVISGGAIEQGSEYGSRNASDPLAVEGDETEDLFILLSLVKSHHPDVQGVSVGAILSNYQRVRVEHVCRRLGLTPLCYLWQRDQKELLDEMIQAGMNAILIKVAGIGLSTKHLGKTLAEMQPILTRLSDLYGSHICGEGGEYETLTLDCPLFKQEIVLQDVETVIHSDNDFASVAFLRIKGAHLKPKPTRSSSEVKIPPLLESPFSSMEEIISYTEDHAKSLRSTDIDLLSFQEPRLPQAQRHARRVNSWVSISNIQRQEPSVDTSIEDEVGECFANLRGRLADYSLSLRHCAIINVLLSSMDLFGQVNSAYGTFFGTSPPARACVAVDLPPGIRVRLDCLAFSEEKASDRHALHVQGLSYWAPANIGPYSQAISVGEHVFVSGQIGLIPRNLSLPSPRVFGKEMALVSQHALRIVDAIRSNTGGGWAGYPHFDLYWLTEEGNVANVRQANRALAQETDVPTLYVVVKALPRNALVEKQVLLHTGRLSTFDRDTGETLLQPHKPRYDAGRLDSSPSSTIYWEVTQFDGGPSCAIFCVRGDIEDAVLLSNPQLQWILKMTPSLLSVRLFYDVSVSSNPAAFNQFITGQGSWVPTLIPCRHIFSRDMDRWDYALVTLSM